MPLYTDVFGNRGPLPAGRQAEWRTSCHAIVRRSDTLLMARPLDGTIWELPGGGVEPGVDASLVDAVIRECLEETGHTLVPEVPTLRFGGEIFVHALRQDRYLTVLTFYVEGTVDGEQDPAWLANPIEQVEVAWLDPATLTRENALWYQIDALREMGVIAGRDEAVRR